jgi:hypothetical protein
VFVVNNMHTFKIMFHVHPCMHVLWGSMVLFQ